MNTATRSTTPAELAASSAPQAPSTWAQIAEGMPIVIVYRAVRELLRQKAHRQRVLQAFRR